LCDRRGDFDDNTTPTVVHNSSFTGMINICVPIISHFSIITKFSLTIGVPNYTPYVYAHFSVLVDPSVYFTIKLKQISRN